MQITYKTPSGRLTAVLEGEGHKGIWNELSKFAEVFENDTCGKCNSEKIRFTVRRASDGKKEYEYYELRCKDCFAKKSFGVKNDNSGDLFPHNKDSEGNWLPNNGWVKYNKETGREE